MTLAEDNGKVEEKKLLEEDTDTPGDEEQRKADTKRENLNERSRLILTLMAGGFIVIIGIELVVRFYFDPKYAEMRAKAPVNITHVPHAKVSNGPTSWMTNEQFWTSQCIIGMISMIVTGLGLEVALGYELLRTTPITPGIEHGWFVAQFIMSVFHLTTFVCLMERRPWAVLLTVASVWKFGFPETLMQIVIFYQTNRPWYTRLRALMSGVGILCHKVASMLFVSVILWGLSPWTRTLMSFCTPLIMQHVVVPLKYCGIGVGYLLCQLLLEIWWEWEIFNSFQLIYLPTGVPMTRKNPYPYYSPLLIRSCLGMLVAHWLYWFSGVINKIGKMMAGKKKAGRVSLQEYEGVLPESRRVGDDDDPAAVAPKESAISRGSVRKWQLEFQDDSQIINEADRLAKNHESITGRDSVNKWQADFREFAL